MIIERINNGPDADVIEDKTFRKNYSGGKLRNQAYIGCTFDGCEFKNIDATNVKFIGCTFMDCKFIDCTFNNIGITENSRCELDVLFKDCTGKKFFVHNSNLNYSTFDHNTIKGMNLEHVVAKPITVKDNTIKYAVIADIELDLKEKTAFENNTIETMSAFEGKLSGSDISYNTIENAYLENFDIDFCIPGYVEIACDNYIYGTHAINKEGDHIIYPGKEQKYDWADVNYTGTVSHENNGAYIEGYLTNLEDEKPVKIAYVNIDTGEVEYFDPVDKNEKVIKNAVEEALYIEDREIEAGDVEDKEFEIVDL